MSAKMKNTSSFEAISLQVMCRYYVNGSFVELLNEKIYYFDFKLKSHVVVECIISAYKSQIIAKPENRNILLFQTCNIMICL